MKLSFYAVLSSTFLLAACAQNNKSHITDTQAVQMAESQKQSGNAAGAVQILQQALADHPNDPVILGPLGFALIANRQPQDAVGVFDQLIALKPNDAGAYNGKAVALDRSFRHDAAQSVYRRALTLAPDSPTIQNNLAMSMILNGQVDQAIALLEKLERRSGGNQTIRQNLALAYGIKSDKKKALALNLEDLPEAEAKENMRFYETYAGEYKEFAAHSHESLDNSNAPASLDDLLSSRTEAAVSAPPADTDPAPQKNNATAPAFPFSLRLTPDPTYPSQGRQ